MRASADPLFVEEEVPIRDDLAHRAGVRCMTGHTTPVAAGSPAVRSFRSYDLEYDRAGTRIRHEKFGRDGRLVRRWRYDAEGRLTREVTYDATGAVEYWFDIVHDDLGWIEKRMYSWPDHLQYRIVSDRDASGWLLRAIYHDPAGQVLRADTYDYDSLGLLVHVAMGHIGECSYAYDQRRNLQRKSRILPGMSEYGDIHEFAYDHRDLLIRMDHRHFCTTTFVLTTA